MNISRITATAVNLLFTTVIVLTAGIFIGTSWGYLPSRYWWISLVLLFAAEVLAYGSILFVIRSSRRAKGAVPAAVPYITISVLYAAAVLFHIVVFWLIIHVPFRTYMIIHFVTVAAAVAALAVTAIQHRYVKEQQDEQEARTDLFKQTQGKLQNALYLLQARSLPGEAGLKSKLAQLQDKARYSDPVSHPSLVAIEESLFWQSNELEKWIRSSAAGSTEAKEELPLQLIADMDVELEKRNRQLIALK
ncbi:hypothetical protein [Gorillibacterium massiliense]|uniref:hypothetical protein n=1 Tax=Gorillibacterium massiliense TaxID=1280390 RepID=UPI0004B91231|nr:hypothetical protein [Gorillibacterium massiliense]